MYTLNQLTIIGFTGNEADIHYTTNGTLVATLSVATKQSWKDAEGEWQSRTDWHRVVMFGKVAEYGTHDRKRVSGDGAGPSPYPRIRKRWHPTSRVRIACRDHRQAGSHRTARACDRHRGL